MNREYIESGILELYVFGQLSEAENKEVQQMAAGHRDVQDEIIAIEKAVINLSYSVSPYLSAENYEKIRHALIEKHEGVVTMPARRSNFTAYMGWAASFILLLGLAFQYYKYNEAVEQTVQVKTQSSKYQQLLANLEVKNRENEKSLDFLRDQFTSSVALGGQQAAPESYAKVYINSNTNETYVDVAGLPEPPEGKVYQVWALKLDPLTPTSIGIVESTGNGLYKVDTNAGAEAFGITLEPAGGSPTPTLEQLYTLGKV